MTEWIQLGAVGVLGLVIVGAGRAALPIVKSLIASINGLGDEVASFRRQQQHMSNLLTLLLAREFGEEKALELLREEHDVNDQTQPRQGDQQGRGEAAAGPRGS